MDQKLSNLPQESLDFSMEGLEPVWRRGAGSQNDASCWGPQKNLKALNIVHLHVIL